MAPAYSLMAQVGGGGMNATMMGVYVVALIAIFYFLMFRPQQKQRKEQQEMLGALKKGDDVVTQSGLLGKIYAVTDKIITLEIASGVRVRVLKGSVTGKVTVTDEVAVAPKAEEKS